MFAHAAGSLEIPLLNEMLAPIDNWSDTTTQVIGSIACELYGADLTMRNDTLASCGIWLLKFNTQYSTENQYRVSKRLYNRQ